MSRWTNECILSFTWSWLRLGGDVGGGWVMKWEYFDFAFYSESCDHYFFYLRVWVKGRFNENRSVQFVSIGPVWTLDLLWFLFEIFMRSWSASWKLMIILRNWIELLVAMFTASWKFSLCDRGYRERNRVCGGWEGRIVREALNQLSGFCEFSMIRHRSLFLKHYTQCVSIRMIVIYIATWTKVP